MERHTYQRLRLTSATPWPICDGSFKRALLIPDRVSALSQKSLADSTHAAVHIPLRRGLVCSKSCGAASIILCYSMSSFPPLSFSALNIWVEYDIVCNFIPGNSLRCDVEPWWRVGVCSRFYAFSRLMKIYTIIYIIITINFFITTNVVSCLIMNEWVIKWRFYEIDLHQVSIWNLFQYVWMYVKSLVFTSHYCFVIENRLWLNYIFWIYIHIDDNNLMICNFISKNIKWKIR